VTGGKSKRFKKAFYSKPNKRNLPILSTTKRKRYARFLWESRKGCECSKVARKTTWLRADGERNASLKESHGLLDRKNTGAVRKEGERVPEKRGKPEVGWSKVLCSSRAGLETDAPKDPLQRGYGGLESKKEKKMGRSGR